MKKGRMLFPLLLVFSALNLQSCAKTLTAECYAISKVESPLGLRFSKTEVEVYNGSMSAVSIEETYSPNAWARLSNENASSLGSDNVITVEDVKLEDGSYGNVQYAKYIQVMGDTWYGTLRQDSDDDPYFRYNEYVQYSSMTNTDETAADLIRYLSVKDSTTYQLGSRVGSYFDSISKNEVKIMKATSGKDKEAKLEETSIALSYPNANSYRSNNDSAWKDSISALCSYLKGKKMNYRERISDDDLNHFDTLQAKEGTWYYNPQLISYDGMAAKTVENINETGAEKIEGCSSRTIDAVSMNSYFESVNWAFASVEYASIS